MSIVNPADKVFLMLEKRQQPMHIGTLQLFSYPEGAGPKYVTQLAEYLRSFTDIYPPFNQKIVTRFGQEFWEEDRYFDLEHHFRHAALPKPGRIRELLAYVSAEHSNLMDRERPLWEVHLIEGLRDRRFALYTKIHHSLMDGTSGMRLMMRTFSTDPEDRGIPPVWAVPPRQRSTGGKRSKSSVAAERPAEQIVKQLMTLPNVVREAGTALFGKAPGVVTSFDAPPSILNQKITGSRRFAAQSYSMSRIKAIGRAFDATLNDVVLAVCGGALREYLISLSALPEKPLISMVPVSLRDEESEGGNDIALVLANLGTDIADPLRRIEAVKASIGNAKDRFKRMTPNEQKLYTAVSMMPAGVNMLSGGLLPQMQTFNVVISNVPGPRDSMYWNGARMEGIYPVAFLMDHMALNITLLSYRDSLEFGITACRRTLPSMQKLLIYIENAIEELERAAGINVEEALETAES